MTGACIECGGWIDGDPDTGYVDETLQPGV